VGKDTASLNERLGQAAARGDLGLVNTLLAEGANVNARNKMGVTALMEAALTGKSDVAKVPLDKGAEVNALNRLGMTALKISRERGAEDILELLKAHGGAN